MAHLTPAAALVIVPPSDIGTYIKSFTSSRVSPNCKEVLYSRWMVHIRLAYPFLSPSSFVSTSLEEQIKESIRQLPPFQVHIEDVLLTSSVGVRGMTQFTLPITDLSLSISNVRAAIESSLGSFEYHPFEISIGQTESTEQQYEETVAKIRMALKRKSFWVNEIHYITRDGCEPFQIKATYQLEGASTNQTDEMTEQKSDAWGLFEDDNKTEVKRTLKRNAVALQRVLEKKKKNPKREMEIVLKRVATWLDNRNGISHLPKTKPAFQTAIAKLCIVNGAHCKELAEKILKGFEERGWITPGKRADSIVYHLDALVPPEMVFSFFQNPKNETLSCA
eukprot:TRINITY_DN6385_c0_g1_i2.p1 TRINITY_DN6385_c0_g1~~TRINITY_DN6385_c0_g1_i2.p1  ORF type:complete len:335 (+),score=70.93 TRINITY_DN6385_c0_g1_i2:38-1042(+)